MAVAWSRISSKSIADSPCALRLVGIFVGARRYRQRACVAQPAGRGKREVGGRTVRRTYNSAVSLLLLPTRRRGGRVSVHKPHNRRSPGSARGPPFCLCDRIRLVLYSVPCYAQGVDTRCAPAPAAASAR